VSIQNLTFDAGVTFLPCTYLVHHRADLYPDPEQFLPERFAKREYDSYEYFPFGGGTRLCIGNVLSFIELQIVLATILTTWTLEPANTGEVAPILHGTLLAPSDAMRIRVTAIPRARGADPFPEAQTETSD
jgi:cytochrome P450 family 110